MSTLLGRITVDPNVCGGYAGRIVYIQYKIDHLPGRHIGPIGQNIPPDIPRLLDQREIHDGERDLPRSRPVAAREGAVINPSHAGRDGVGWPTLSSGIYQSY